MRAPNAPKAQAAKMLSIAIVCAMSMVAGGLACAPKNQGAQQPSCGAPQGLATGGPSTGQAMVFWPDPIVESGNAFLSPVSTQLDSYRQAATLDHLGGEGVLVGQYVDVRNGGCTVADSSGNAQEWFNAYDTGNQFSYSVTDTRFSEAMAYYAGDTFRSDLDSIGYLQPAGAVRVVAHCQRAGAANNAFYEHLPQADGSYLDLVCVGDSTYTKGASFADDAIVTIHELEHASTLHNYTSDPQESLNQFSYDEAGSLNEAISDFMGLLQTAPYATGVADPETFSRWALGVFIPGESAIRGARKCPVYDSSYPSCSSFPAFSAEHNHVSYVYPDGVGWSYANDFTGPAYVASSFKTYMAQQEIHNAGVLMEGALWDVYQALGGQAEAQTASALVYEALRSIAHPDANFYSPVNFPDFASALVSAAAAPALGLTSQQQTAVHDALKTRGLVDETLLPLNWAAAGPGKTATPGIEVLDDPTTLRGWLAGYGVPSGQLAAIVPQGFDTGSNGELDPGETVALWFDLKNTNATTAGGVKLIITSADPSVVSFGLQTPDGYYVNDGIVVDPSVPAGSTVQVNYGKVNGSAVVQALTSANATYNVPTDVTYFKTDPFFDQSPRLAIWARVAKGTSGKTATFSVQAFPANLAAFTHLGDVPAVTFTAKIN